MRDGCFCPSRFGFDPKGVPLASSAPRGLRSDHVVTVGIVLVLMGLVHGFCDAHPQVWVWVGGVVAVQSVITSVRDAFFAGSWLPFDVLPLADIGATWAPVAVVAFVIGLLHSHFVAHSRS